MNTIHTLALAAALSVGASVPAFAAWENLGTVDFGRRGDTEQQFTRFAGPVDKLMLTADRNGVECRAVTVRFDNRRSRNVFSGRLREDRPRVIDLPGNDRNIRSISLTCRSLGRGQAIVRISGDVDRYRDQWRRGDWFDGDRSDNRGRDNDRGGIGFNYSLPLGNLTFGREFGRDQEFTGWGGRSLDAIAVRANNDAVCRTATIRFANGSTQRTDVGNRGRLEEGRNYRIDLRGNERNVRSVSLVCRAERAPNVVVSLSGNGDVRIGR